ncbi:AsmA family protein [Roseovarius autotrophicus]|uniref:AsmA family protein n=1 Tax=Roseovarius autotrophicus TaxID=2824121 RepID=UPI0019EBFB4E|nr:AsmA family protein [Roseovarius autotrophicus]MBE0453560.1 AsmA family protein [Roseovarius sp.]
MRWLVRLIGLVVVLAAFFLGALFFLPGERIAKIAAEQITRATGRTVTMSGETRLSLYPVLGVSTGAVEIANADWSKAGPMLRADSFKVGVDPKVLWGGDIRITGLEAINPEIRLERATDGRVNWELGVEGVAPSGQSEGGTPARSARLGLTLDRALITGARLVLTDHSSGEVHQITGLDLDLRWPDYDGTATLEASFRRGSGAIRVSGHLDEVGAFLDGAATGVAATLSAGGGTVGFAGRAGLRPEAQGRLDLDIGDTGAFLASLGVGGVDLPQSLGRSVTGRADVTVTNGTAVALREVALRLGGNSLTGAADIDLAGEVPRFNAQINAGALDLSKLAGADTTGGGVASGWSKERIDASGLALANGELAFAADSVNLGDLKLGRTRALMVLDRSRAAFDLREVRAYDGLVTGEFVVNNRAGLSVGGATRAEGINLERFLTDAMGITRFAASGSGEMSFLGSGASVEAIMKSLSGKGRVSTGRGVISGFDLDRLMRSGDVTGGTTVFDSMSASFTMEGGNLFNQDLAMRLPLARAEGKGRVGLGARDLDYLFTPVLLEGETSRGLAIPVRIRGTWENPKITPDLEKALDLNLKAEREELEKKAEERIEREMQKQLGVTPQEGQSTQDAIQKKLEDKATKKLRKLFD